MRDLKNVLKVGKDKGFLQWKMEPTLHISLKTTNIYPFSTPLEFFHCYMVNIKKK